MRPDELLADFEFGLLTAAELGAVVVTTPALQADLGWLSSHPALRSEVEGALRAARSGGFVTLGGPAIAGRIPTPRPVVISAEIAHHRVVCRLMEGKEQLPRGPHPDSLSLDYPAPRATDPPELWPHISSLLTGLELAQLSALGGVRIVDAMTQQTLWQWPQRAA